VTGGTLNFNGTTPTVTVDSGTAVINSALTGTAGLVKSGNGTLTIDTKVATGNEISGAFTANGGTVIVTDTSGANANIGLALKNITSFTLSNATMSLQGTQNALTATGKAIILNGGTLSADRADSNNGHAMGSVTMNAGSFGRWGEIFFRDSNVFPGVANPRRILWRRLPGLARPR